MSEYCFGAYKLIAFIIIVSFAGCSKKPDSGEKRYYIEEINSYLIVKPEKDQSGENIVVVSLSADDSDKKPDIVLLYQSQKHLDYVEVPVEEADTQIAVNLGESSFSVQKGSLLHLYPNCEILPKFKLDTSTGNKEVLQFE